MKWVPFATLGLVALVLQTTVAPRMAIHGIRPDLVFVLIVHYALWGPWPDVGIGACLLGLAMGTQTSDPMGLHAFCYGAATWGIVRMRQMVFREHPLTQISIALVFTFLIQLAVWLAHQWLAPRHIGWGDVFWRVLMTSLYSGACAPFVHWLLHRIARSTGLRSTSRTPSYR